MVIKYLKCTQKTLRNTYIPMYLTHKQIIFELQCEIYKNHFASFTI